MWIDIAHTTTYRFSRPVCLESHTIRLRPRGDPSQRLDRFALLIEPRPAGLADHLDLEGNSVAHAWFVGDTPSLTVTAHSRVETLRGNPFDYILSDPSGNRLPLVYAEALAPSLAPYSAREPSDGAVARFAASLVEEVDGRPLPFLTALSSRIFQTCHVTPRVDGPPLPAGLTLAQRRGACRDLAVLFVDTCRAVGFGARFVSGYQHEDPERERPELHAWAEVYLPGGGWRGYDPTQGLAVGDRHVALAAAARPDQAAPIAGAFRGTGVSSFMQAAISVRSAQAGGP